MDQNLDPIEARDDNVPILNEIEVEGATRFSALFKKSLTWQNFSARYDAYTQAQRTAENSSENDKLNPQQLSDILDDLQEILSQFSNMTTQFSFSLSEYKAIQVTRGYKRQRSSACSSVSSAEDNDSGLGSPTSSESSAINSIIQIKLTQKLDRIINRFSHVMQALKKIGELPLPSREDDDSEAEEVEDIDFSEDEATDSSPKKHYKNTKLSNAIKRINKCHNLMHNLLYRRSTTTSAHHTSSANTTILTMDIDTLQKPTALLRQLFIDTIETVRTFEEHGDTLREELLLRRQQEDEQAQTVAEEQEASQQAVAVAQPETQLVPEAELNPFSQADLENLLIFDDPELLSQSSADLLSSIQLQDLLTPSAPSIEILYEGEPPENIDISTLNEYVHKKSVTKENKISERKKQAQRQKEKLKLLAKIEHTCFERARFFTQRNASEESDNKNHDEVILIPDIQHASSPT